MKSRRTLRAQWSGAVVLAVVTCAAVLMPVTATAAEAYEAQVEVRAAVGSTRTYAWTIDKTVDVNSFDLHPGESANANYTVTLTRDGGSDSDFALLGEITISNPAPSPMTVTGVTVSVIGDNPVPVSGITLPLTLPAGGHVQATFNEALPVGAGQLLLINVSTTGLVGGYSGLVSANYDGPTSFINDAVTVDDSLVGALGTLADSGSFTYAVQFAYDDAGTQTNVATIMETGQTDSADVTVNALPDNDAVDDLRETVDFFDASVVSGALTGAGRGKSATGRLGALRNMMGEAEALLAADAEAEALAQLRATYERCDGELKPADFVQGSAHLQLSAKILALIAQLES